VVSITTRILLGFLLILGAAFYFLMSWLTDRVDRQYLEAAEEPMVDMAHVMAALLEQEFAREEVDFTHWKQGFENVQSRSIDALIYDFEKTSVDMNVYVTDAEGVVLFDSDGGRAEGESYLGRRDVFLTLSGAYGARSTRTDESDEFSSVMFVGAPIRKGGEIVGVLSVSKPQASLLQFINETKERILYYCWSSFVAIMLAAVLVVHWFSSPMRKLTDYARAVRRGERVAMPRVNSPEARTLARALDEMRDSLEDRKYVESYVQTLTHEMKGPVAAIRGASELLEEKDMPEEQRERFQENIRNETVRLQNIIDRLLALSAIESMKTLEKPTDVNLGKLVDEVCALHEHAFESYGVVLKKELDSLPVIKGEAFLLEMALGNLLQNALEFSPQGGCVTVLVAKEEGRVVIRVRDDGAGIPEYAKERVFERFYSLPHPQTGQKSSGLGLCFVREAAELHGGSVRLDNLAEGGAEAVFSLPG
jgi:two-component system sensor histidine kinase CreC